MNGRNMSLVENSSSGEQETDQKYEYLKMLNRDLVNEVVMLRQAKSQMQSDNDFLLRKNMDADFKNNECMQILSNIDRRSKVCLNKIVECSTELTQIINLAKSIMNIENRKSSEETPVSSKKNSNSFKQVVTPHAVNGHIIHTPTIRLARYNEPIPQGQNGRINQEEHLDDDDEDSHHSNDEMNEIDPENETDEHYNESQVPDESETEESEVSMKLQTIQEESPTQSMMEEQERPIFSGTCHEVKIYLNQTTSKNLRVNNKRGVGGSGDYVPDDSPKRESTNITRKSSVISSRKSKSPQRNSLAKRKSLGSPVPPKIQRRNGSLGKPSCSTSSISPNITGSSATVFKDASRNISEEYSANGLRRNSEGNSLYATSIPSTSTVQYSNIEATKSEISAIATMDDTPEFSVSVLQNNDSSMNIDKNSIHSTPLSRTLLRSLSKGSKTSTGSKVTRRRKGAIQSCSRGSPKKELVVKLERFDLEELEKSIKSSNSFNEKRQRGENSAEIETKSLKKIKKEMKIESASPANAAIVRARPKRAAKPIGSFQEPRCNTKMRREF